MKLAFLGTPEVAAGTLRALADAGHDVRMVVTRPDTRRGRGPEASPSAGQASGGGTRLAACVPGRRRPRFGSRARGGRRLRQDRQARRAGRRSPWSMSIFRLLPRWRGAAPVERAILAGDAETGVCLMELEEGLDTGPVYARVRTPIGEDETADELRRRLGQPRQCAAPGGSARGVRGPDGPGGRAHLRGQARAGRAPPRFRPAG